MTNSEGYLEKVHIGNGTGLIMSGISFWTVHEANVIKDELLQLIADGDYNDLFWDHSVIRVMKRFHIHVQQFDDLYEMDTIEDIHRFKHQES